MQFPDRPLEGITSSTQAGGDILAEGWLCHTLHAYVCVQPQETGFCTREERDSDPLSLVFGPVSHFLLICSRGPLAHQNGKNPRPSDAPPGEHVCKVLKVGCGTQDGGFCFLALHPLLSIHQ